MSKTENTGIISEAEVSKSNSLLTAKYSSNARTLKLLTTCMAKINPYSKAPKEGIEIHLSVCEIKKVLGLKGNSIYSQMQDIRNSIAVNNTYYFDSEDDKTTGFFVLVDNVKFSDDSGLTVHFGQIATKFLYELQKSKDGFTTYRIANILNLTSCYAIRFYELFRQRLYLINDDMPFSEIEYGLEELKFTIGVYNTDKAEYQKCREAMLKGETDYEKIISYAKVAKLPYSRYNNFRAKVLEPSKRELEKYTDICFEYVPIRKGRKISSIKFRIYKNVPVEKSISSNQKRVERVLQMSEEGREAKKALCKRVIELLDYQINMNESEKICEAAGYDAQIIEESVLQFPKDEKNDITSKIIENIYSKKADIIPVDINEIFSEV